LFTLALWLAIAYFCCGGIVHYPGIIILLACCGSIIHSVADCCLLMPAEPSVVAVLFTKASKDIVYQPMEALNGHRKQSIVHHGNRHCGQ